MAQANLNSKPSILLVDDEEGLRSLLEDLLKQVGFRVQVAATGMHAMQKIKSGCRPDLIISDFRMPGMNGGQFIKQFKMDFPELKTEVLFMTGYPDRELIGAIKALGIKHVLVKPFPLEDLIKEINRILNISIEIKGAA